MLFRGIKIPARYRNLLSEIGNIGDRITNTAVIGLSTDETEAICFISDMTLSSWDSMLDDDVRTIASVLRMKLQCNQGIVEVNKGNTASGKRYVYNITKESVQGDYSVPYRTCYCIDLTMEVSNGTLNIRGTFGDGNAPSKRERTVHKILLEEHMEAEERGDNSTNYGVWYDNNWLCDPYDRNWTKGFLMNESEGREYDEMFPGHPLTEARELVDYLILNN